MGMTHIAFPGFDAIHFDLSSNPSPPLPALSYKEREKEVYVN
jgi:hypothetical protein